TNTDSFKAKAAAEERLRKYNQYKDEYEERARRYDDAVNARKTKILKSYRNWEAIMSDKAPEAVDLMISVSPKQKDSSSSRSSPGKAARDCGSRLGGDALQQT